MTHNILHIDGDSFFASCEIALNPVLRGKPVVTGHERGIASAMSAEAKRAGVTRGMPISQVRRICPEAMIVSSNYKNYEIFSARMLEIVRRYSDQVEKYSIDECFADMGDVGDVLERAHELQQVLRTELGLPFSIGIGPNKLLAKAGSNLDKPYGLVEVRGCRIDNVLKNISIGDIWGIGRRLAPQLVAQRIRTAYAFKILPESYIRRVFNRPLYEMWQEMNGAYLNTVDPSKKRKYHSLQKTRSFRPTDDYEFLVSQLSKNIEYMCRSLREHDHVTNTVHFFLKTKDMKYHGHEVHLGIHTNAPHIIMNAIESYIRSVYSSFLYYRATGVTALKLRPIAQTQYDLFGETEHVEGMMPIYRIIDQLDHKFGRHSVFLSTSMASLKRDKEYVSSAPRKMGIPILGIVK